MQIPVHYIPEACCANTKFSGEDTDAVNSAYGHLHLDTQRKRLCASDGSITFAVEVKVAPADYEGPIPADVLKYARSHAVAVGETEVTIQCGKKELRVMQGDEAIATFDRPKTEDRFPDWKRLVNAARAAGLGIGVVPAFMVDASRTRRLAKAFGTKTLLIEQTGEAQPLIVNAPGRPEAIALMDKTAAQQDPIKAAEEGDEEEVDENSGDTLPGIMSSAPLAAPKKAKKAKAKK